MSDEGDILDRLIDAADAGIEIVEDQPVRSRREKSRMATWAVLSVLAKLPEMEAVRDDVRGWVDDLEHKIRRLYGTEEVS